MRPKVSIVISSFNMAHLLPQTIQSCREQTYKNVEIVLYDDCSTDGTDKINFGVDIYARGKKNLGVGSGFNAAIALASGDIIVLFCSDDLFTNEHVISDIVATFESDKEIGYVTRYYYQFIDDKIDVPVRAWHCDDPIILANNPSGLAFRKTALVPFVREWCSNKMFIETSSLASRVIDAGWKASILDYDAVAVRVHDSTSTKREYWLKRRVSSPVMDWYNIGGKDIAKDYVSLIQIKCNFKLSALLEEIWNFVKLRPMNILSPTFLFFAVCGIFIPRKMLRKLPHLYRKYIGGYITKKIERTERLTPVVKEGRIKVKLRSYLGLREYIVSADIVRMNYRTCIVRLDDGNIIKRHLTRDCVL